MDHSTSAQFVGGSFALASAALWAAASILWIRLGKDVSPIGMNLGKGLFALVCLGVGFVFLGFPSADPFAWTILGLSGIIGISIGDTTYFAALMRLGPRRILALTTLTPLATSGLAILVLGESPTLQWVVGAALCLSGVGLVLRERLPKETTGSWKAGVWLGLLTVACDGIGQILSKIGMQGMDSQGPMDATFIRLTFGVAGLLVFGLHRFRVRQWLAPFRSPRLVVVLLIASFVGTFLGIWFSLAALHYSDVTFATVLNSTNPLFILPMAALFLGERITWRAVLGVVVAIGGVAVLLSPP